MATVTVTTPLNDNLRSVDINGKVEPLSKQQGRTYSNTFHGVKTIMGQDVKVGSPVFNSKGACLQLVITAGSTPDYTANLTVVVPAGQSPCMPSAQVMTDTPSTTPTTPTPPPSDKLTRGNKIQIAIAALLGVLLLVIIVGGMESAAYHKNKLASRR
jgi:hypothetical protein